MYELSWLNSQGLPQVAIGHVELDATTENLIESKALSSISIALIKLVLKIGTLLKKHYSKI